MNSEIKNLKSITVLYVEDEDDLREITASILKSFTKRQFIASNGQEGYELFLANNQEIDLIITDVNMPILNGLAMIDKIKNINSRVPIIVTTAFSNKEYLLEAINIGVDKYVLKPVDISKLLQAMTQSLNYHELKDLFIDNLTKLSNKNKLRKDLRQSKSELMALLDIDDFMATNDLFGEDIGDKILKEFANKIRAFFNSDEYLIYRIEADKFAVIPKDNDNINDFFTTCKEFLEKLENEYFVIDDNEIDINLTIGIAKASGSKAHKYAKRIINYARKKLQKIMIYDDAYNIHKSYEENITWIKWLKQGFKDKLLKAYFQPIVDTKTQNIVKYEALIRYISPDGVEYGPYSFLHVAKKTKFYSEIIKVILKDSLTLIKNKNKKVSVNISYEDILDEKTTQYIYNLLEENKEFASNLEFEILETEDISDFDLVKNFTNSVSKFGCLVGIDDFGAGYSNFHLLSRLNINFIKIDSSLIKNIHESKDLEIIVKTISNIAKELNIKTVAEFVASEEIYQKVKSLNIDYSQGFYFDKPLSYDKIA